MEFQRNEYFDNLIVKINENEKEIKELSLEELSLLVEYLTKLKKYLKDKKEKI